LLCLDEEIRRLPTPTPSPAVRAALMERIAGSPETIPGETVPLPRRRSGRGLMVRAAAMLLVTAGFFWSLTVDRDPPADGPRGDGNAPADTDVLARALERQLQVAGGLPPDERFHVLVGLAADLRAESLRLARQPALSELSTVAQLYDQVVREGVMGRARRLPAEQQRRLLLPLLEDLRQTEAEVERTAHNTPADVAESLRGLATTARAARVELQEILEDGAL